MVQTSYKLGIVGGMGPLATIDLINRIMEFTKSEKDQDHIPIVVISNPAIPDRTESICYNAISPFPMLLQSIRDIDKITAEFIIVPCNTAHYYINELQEHTNTRIINMVKATVDYIKYFLDVKRVVVLGTDGLIKGRVYDEYLNRHEIKNQLIDTNAQNTIMTVIRNIKSNGALDEFKNMVHRTLKEIDPKQELCFVLACTELSLLKNYLSQKGWEVVDAVDVLSINAIKLTKFELNIERIKEYDTEFKGRLYEFAIS